MSVIQTHPQFEAMLSRWTKCRDAYDGEYTVKSRRELYLPPTSGMRAAGMSSVNSDGYLEFEAYLGRAVFPGLMSDTVDQLVGAMHHKPPITELPHALDYWKSNATTAGEGVESLLRRINAAQLCPGRVGMLLDIQRTPGQPRPRIALYDAECVPNWDPGQRGETGEDSISFASLNESAPYREPGSMSWSLRERYRIIEIENGVYTQRIVDGAGNTTEEPITPVIGGRHLDRIPFVFVNTSDIDPDVSKPPLEKLSDLLFAIYRGEADYRQSLFMQGQDTLILIGGLLDDTAQGEAKQVGAGARLNVQMGGDAKYIGVESDGLSEQREALANDYRRAEQLGSRLIDTSTRERESGEALGIRQAAATASLGTIADTAASGVDMLARIALDWLGAAEPADAIITANRDFATTEVTAPEIADFVAARSGGLPWSRRSIHGYLRKRELTELTYEEELEELAKDAADLPDIDPAEQFVARATTT